MKNSAHEKSNSSTIHKNLPDWNSVQKLLDNNSVNSESAFDLHISRREGNEFKVRLELQPDIPNKTTGKTIETPIVIRASLYDLSW